MLRRKTCLFIAYRLYFQLQNFNKNCGTHSVHNEFALSGCNLSLSFGQMFNIAT